MTFCDNSDFAPLVPLRDGKGAQMTEMEEVARGEDFLQAGVGEIWFGMPCWDYLAGGHDGELRN